MQLLLMFTCEFEIIDFFAVFNIIASLVMCEECGESAKFEKCQV